MAAQVFSHLSSDLRRSGIVPRILIVLIFLLLLPLPSATADPHGVLVDRADPQIALRPVLGSGVIPGNEPTAAAATRSDALVAINGGFFTVSTGHPLGLLVIDGKLLSTPPPEDGSVLSAASGEGRLITDRLVENQQVRLNLAISPAKIIHALGGGPRLVADGEVSVPYRWESFGPGFSKRRTSRSAVGITAAGKVLLVRVEKSRRNTGMNLFELARLMRDLGAGQAMNLDGGGSSTLVVGGRVVNRAEGAQRGGAPRLLVVRKPPE